MTGVDKLARWLSWAVAAVVVLFLLGPLVVTVVVSFTSSSIYTLPPPEWSLRWYEALARKSGLADAVWLSVQIALLSTALALVLAHVIVTLPFVMRTLLAALERFDFSLIDAARTLGLSYPQAVLKVLAPGLAPAFLTSGLFAFLASMDNYPISIFLTDARNKTLPIKMLQYLEEQPDPTLAAISTGLIVLALIALAAGSRAVGLNRMVH